jgi:hypothetical protein
MLKGLRGARSVLPTAPFCSGAKLLATCDDPDRSFDDHHRDRALQLLTAALEILDEHADLPEVGARLQGVIDALVPKVPTGRARLP